MTFRLFLIFNLVCSCAWGADGLPVSDADRLARWIAAQQCVQSNLPSYGGLKAAGDAAAIGPNGKPYYCITPYYANLAVGALLQTGAPHSGTVASLWIHWYFAHLDPNSAPDGVPADEFCRSDGTGETNCVKPGDPQLCRHNDATDSAAATFFSVLQAAHQAGVPAASFAAPDRRHQIQTLADVVLKLQQADGLCWAKADYRVKYLEDNSEVFAGLRDLATLELDLFNDPVQAAVYRQAAERVRTGILKELYDSKARLFLIGKFEDGSRPPTSLDKWYPDTQAQMWPLLFGVVAVDAPAAKAVVSALDHHWNGVAKPAWESQPGQVNDGSLEAADAYALLLAGHSPQARTFVAAAKKTKFRDSDGLIEPFNVADAGWWLLILHRLPPDQ
jgi:hypothetical protein